MTSRINKIKFAFRSHDLIGNTKNPLKAVITNKIIQQSRRI